MEIGAITFIVKDMEKMVTFYRDVMNMAMEWDGDKEFERLVKAGATPIKEPISQPYGLREAVVADPEGNLLEIVAGIPQE